MGQIWSQIKKLIFLENGVGGGGSSKSRFDPRALTWTLTTLEHIIYSTLVVFVNTDYARDTPQAGLGGRDDID